MSGTTAAVKHTAAAPSSIFHGDAENLAVEQRQDKWWKTAEAEVDRGRGFQLASRQPEPQIFLRGNPQDKLVALTFDDGPHPGKVQQLLGVLRALNVKATFFVIGKMVERHPELIRLEAAEGHEVEDHSFSHVNLSKIPEREVDIEYRACSDLIDHVIGVRPRFGRPPGGQATPAVAEGAAENRLVTAMWSDDPKDYANPGAETIEQRVLRHVSSGGVILLHEGVEQTVDVLPDLVHRLRAEGYRFVTMDQLYSLSKPPKRLLLRNMAMLLSSLSGTHAARS